MIQRIFTFSALILLVLGLLLVNYSDRALVQNNLPIPVTHNLNTAKEYLVEFTGYLLGLETPTPPAGPADKKESYTISVEATPVVRRNIQRSFESYGSFTFKESVRVSSTREGKIVDMQVEKAGERIRAGETIAVLEQTGLEINKLQARINKQKKEISLQLARSKKSTLLTEIRRTRANYDKNLEELRYTQANYRRNLDLYRIDALTEQELSDIAMKRFRAVSTLLDTKIKLLQLKKQLEEVNRKIELAKTEIENARKSLARANYQLSQTVIKSPITGVIATKDVSEGEVLKPGETTLVKVIKVDQVYLVCKLPETKLPVIHNGQKVIVYPDAYPRRELTGSVRNIDPLVNPENRTVKVKVLVDNPDGLLKPGMFASAEFIVGTEDNILAVPREALLQTAAPEKNLKKVYIVKENMAISKQITIGEGNENYVRVRSGLESGTLVVVEGQNRLKDFVRVEPEIVGE